MSIQSAPLSDKHLNSARNGTFSESQTENRHHCHCPSTHDKLRLNYRGSHPASKWQPLGEIILPDLLITKPSGYLFSLIILYKATHKWIEINIKSLWENWKLNHPLLPHFYLLLGTHICNSASKLSYNLIMFSSWQFCVGNPKEDFSYCCVWSKLNVACKKNKYRIVNNWECPVFLKNICR